MIKQAFATQLIENDAMWIEMLDKRKELTHTYNLEQSKKAIQTIRNDYFPPIEQVYQEIKKRCSA